MGRKQGKKRGFGTQEDRARKEVDPVTDQQAGCQALLDPDLKLLTDSPCGHEQMTPPLRLSFS